MDALALLAVAIYAAQAWMSYQWFTIHQLGRSLPSGAEQAYMHALSEALAQYQIGGWGVIGGTVALLIVGVVVAIKR